MEYIRIEIPRTIESTRDIMSGKTAIPIKATPVSASPRLVLRAILLTFFYSILLSKSCPWSLLFWRILPIYSVGDIWWYTRPAEEFVKVHWAVSYSCSKLSIILWSSSFRTAVLLHMKGQTHSSLIDPYYLIGESKALSNPISNQTGISWFIYEIVIFL